MKRHRLKSKKKLNSKHNQRHIQMLHIFKRKLKIEANLDDSTNSDHRCRRIRLWCAKSDLLISAITAVVIFIILLIMVIVNMEVSEKNEKTEDNISKIMKEIESYHTNPATKDNKFKMNSAFCEASSEKTIICKHFNENSIGTLAEQINQASQEYNQLTLEEIKFIDGTIDKGWLDGVITTITILTIKKSNLEIIKENSFSSSSFKLEQLTIEDSDIKVFKKESLLNLQLKTFSLRFQAPRQVEFEEQVFEGIKSSLQILQIINVALSSDSLKNLFGTTGARLSALCTLQLENNQINKIDDFHLTNIPAVNTFSLAANGLVEIDKDAFKYMRKLSTLNLQGNSLEFIPKGIFDNFSKGTINIENNPWNCICSLQWLKDFYIIHQNDFFDGIHFMCSGNRPFDEVNFCGSTEQPPFTTTSTEETTTPPVETTTSQSTAETSTTETPTTPTPSNDVVRITCKNHQKPQTDLSPLEDSTTIVSVRRNSVNFTIAQMGDETLYRVKIEGNVSDDNLIWFNSKNNGETNCRTDLNDVIINLTEESAYTLCLINKNSYQVSPYDCTALAVPPKWEARAWIPNKSQTTIIGAISGGILAAMLVTAIITFYCIRQHPNLIKGNKRVILVESKAADAIILPKTHQQQINYVPPSLNSYSDGYLTPKRCYYDPYYQFQPPIIRTVSGQTLYSASGRLRRNQSRRRAKLEHVTRVFDDHLYEPPPLPPNHPCECSSKLYCRI